MSCAYEYAPQLRSRGFRMTPQRMAIFMCFVMKELTFPRLKSINKHEMDLPGLTEPTVYRTLEFLADNGPGASFLFIQWDI